MTYQQKLDELGLNAKEKSDALVAACMKEGRQDEMDAAKAQAAYEDAERAYHQFLNMIKEHQLSPKAMFF